MGRVVGVEPIFVVSDVPQAVAHYQTLGFSTSHHDEGYAFAHRDGLTIHLAGPGVAAERVGRGSVNLHVDEADALAEEWRSAGPLRRAKRRGAVRSRPARAAATGAERRSLSMWIFTTSGFLSGVEERRGGNRGEIVVCAREASARC